MLLQKSMFESVFFNNNFRCQSNFYQYWKVNEHSLIIIKAPYKIFLCYHSVQITDFGLSEVKRLTAEISRNSTNTEGGTLAYTAPEVFQNINTPPTKALDVYAFGILLWELFTEDIAFDSKYCFQTWK